MADAIENVHEVTTLKGYDLQMLGPNIQQSLEHLGAEGAIIIAQTLKAYIELQDSKVQEIITQAVGPIFHEQAPQPPAKGKGSRRQK